MKNSSDGHTIPEDVRVRLEELEKNFQKLKSQLGVKFSHANDEEITPGLFYFKTIADYTLDWEFWLDKDGKFLYCNPSCERITGYSPKAFYHDPELLINICNPRHRNALLDKIQSSYKGETEAGFQYAIITKEFEERWLSFAYRPIVDDDGIFRGVRGSIRDISESVFAYDKLVKSEQKFILAMEAINDGLWDWNLKTNKVYRNTRQAELLGTIEGEKDFDISDFKSVVHNEDYHVIDLALKSHISGETVIFKEEYRIRKHDGTGWIWVLSKAKAVERDDNGIATRLIGTMTDITERKLKEQTIKNQYIEIQLQYEKLENTNIELKQAHQKLENTFKQLSISELNVLKTLTKEREINNLKTSFITNASHAFRTPVTKVHSNIQLLEQLLKKESNQEPNCILRIKEGMKELMALVENLTTAILDSETTTANNRSFKISYLSEMIFMDLQKSIKNKNRINWINDINDTINTDISALTLILENVISNSLKYSSDDTVIHIHSLIEDDTVVISVQDHGIGIPSDEINCVFEPFFRATNVSKIRGDGLGLAIVKTCAELIKGKILIQSEISKETIFTIQFPLVIV